MSDTARQPLLLPHVVVREGTVEASGRFGELVCRQPEFERILNGESASMLAQDAQLGQL